MGICKCYCSYTNEQVWMSHHWTWLIQKINARYHQNKCNQCFETFTLLMELCLSTHGASYMVTSKEFLITWWITTISITISHIERKLFKFFSPITLGTCMTPRLIIFLVIDLHWFLHIFRTPWVIMILFIHHKNSSI